jgi:hypothetical protein
MAFHKFGSNNMNDQDENPFTSKNSFLFSRMMISQTSSTVEQKGDLASFPDVERNVTKIWNNSRQVKEKKSLQQKGDIPFGASSPDPERKARETVAKPWETSRHVKEKKSLKLRPNLGGDSVDILSADEILARQLQKKWNLESK